MTSVRPLHPVQIQESNTVSGVCATPQHQQQMLGLCSRLAGAAVAQRCRRAQQVKVPPIRLNKQEQDRNVLWERFLTLKVPLFQSCSHGNASPFTNAAKSRRLGNHRRLLISRAAASSHSNITLKIPGPVHSPRWKPLGRAGQWGRGRRRKLEWGVRQACLQMRTICGALPTLQAGHSN